MNKLVKQAAKSNASSLDLRQELLSLPLIDVSLPKRFDRSSLKKILAEIGQLTDLKELDLGYNELGNLPAEIGQLTNLVELNLRHNELTSLPAEIGQLTNLSTLVLSDNQLTSLPAEIKQLTNLTTLVLDYNQLTSLPAEIGQLTNLSTLVLSDNQLTSLPAEIKQLTNLTTLYLDCNELIELPAEIGQLINLTTLVLNYNELIELPAEIGQLINLTTLILRNNKLSSLPSKIGQLNNLTTLVLDDNQLSNLPLEIKQYCDDQATAAIEIPRYYRQMLEQDTGQVYEAKLLILGEGGAGKTSLANKIQNENYQLADNEKSTEGIDIIRWKVPLDNDKALIVNIWDFGGQEIYHTTHQFFLTKRSLYVLVADNRKEDTDFFYWLNAVNLLSEGSPVLIVKNEKQDRKWETDDEQLRRNFLNLEAVLSTNLKNNRGLSKVRQAIKKHICELSHIGTELPNSWVKVRKTLEADTRDHITLETFLTLCEQNGFTRLEDKLQLSEYLHDLGACLHFQDDDLLRKTVILNPTWGTDAVYKVLDNDQIIQSFGKFNREKLADIWKETEYSLMQPELLRLMMNFKLCYEISSNPGTYVAPQLLSVKPPQYDWDKSNNLLFCYSYEFMPKGMLTRIIVEMNPLIEQENNVWRTGVLLRREDARAEVIEVYHRKEIQIRISGRGKRDLLTTIRYEFEKIHKTYKRLGCHELVACNCQTCQKITEPHFFQFKKLTERLDNGRDTIECGNPPYLDANIFSLISDNSSTSMQQTPLQSSTRNQIFISYSHKDRDLFNELKIWLKPLERNGKLKVWDDTKIKSGQIWRKEIDQALASAKVAILLVSPNFIASNFIDENELPPLLEAATNEGLTVLWIPISHSPYKDTEFEKYQAAHSTKEPLDTLSPPMRNKAWSQIYDMIKNAFENDTKTFNGW